MMEALYLWKNNKKANRRFLIKHTVKLFYCLNIDGALTVSKKVLYYK